jgi:hypothetical protein
MSKPTVMLIAGAVGACALTLINSFIGKYAALPPAHTIAAHALAIVYLAALLFALLTLTHGAARLPQSAGFLITAGLALAAPMGTVLLAQKFQLFVPIPLQLTANNLFLPISMALLGAAFGRVLKHPNTLLAAAGFATFFDIVVVTMGTVRQLQSSGSNLIALVSVGAGAPPSSLPGVVKSFPILCGVTIGPADVLFMAFFLSSVALLPRLRSAWNLSGRRTFVWMYGLLFAALVLVETTALPVPALVPMGVAVLIANARHAAFTPQERRDLWIGGGFALICAILMIVGARTLAARNPQQSEPPKYGFTLGRLRSTKELLVRGIVPQSPADQGGVKPGDVIERIEAEKTAQQDNTQLEAMLTAHRGPLRLRVRRAGSPQPLDLIVTAP